MVKLRDFVAGQEIYFIQAGRTVKDAVAIMTEKDIGALCVFQGDRLMGMFSERDLMKRVINKGLDIAKTSVDEVMTREITFADAEENMASALNKMKKYNCRHMPVIENNKLIGVVSLRKLLLHDVSVKEEEIRLLDAYITYSPLRMEENQ